MFESLLEISQKYNISLGNNDELIKDYILNLFNEKINIFDETDPHKIYWNGLYLVCVKKDYVQMKNIIKCLLI
jgi:hypothetical protein